MKNIKLDQNGEPPPLYVVESAINGSLASLADCLKMLPPGAIQNISKVTHLLIGAWDTLDGAGDGGMRCDKLLRGRCENLSWDPPLLTFVIERHGATVNGSSRAELQYWNVNPMTGKAWISRKGQRQLYPMSNKLDVIPLAEGVANEIENGIQSKHLKWHPDGSVRVFVSQIIPETTAQTTVSRRKRFRSALVGEMASKGWKEIKLHTYMKTSGTS